MKDDGGAYTPNWTTAPTTTGTTVGNVTVWPNADPTTWPTTTTTYGTWPTYCTGNIHVWACAHVEICRCGKAQRPKPITLKCGVCGQ